MYCIAVPYMIQIGIKNSYIESYMFDMDVGDVNLLVKIEGMQMGHLRSSIIIEYRKY